MHSLRKNKLFTTEDTEKKREIRKDEEKGM